MANDILTKPFMSYSEFVIFEEHSLTKHEWLDDVVYDWADGTPTHVELERLREQLMGGPLGSARCRFIQSYQARLVLIRGVLLIPDILVICETCSEDATIVKPLIIVEPLPDSKEKYDRDGKFAHYKRIPSLAEYVLVSQKEKCIEIFRRISADEWDAESEKAFAGQTITLKSIECELSVDEVYEDPLAAE
jgi:Uma2 family endonuclease